MKVLFIYKEDYPWDVRVEKIILSLVAAGHTVTLLARNGKRLPREEEAAGFRIRRLPALPGWLGPLNRIFGFPLFFNPIWLYCMGLAMRTTGAQIVIVRDLPLMLGALALAQIMKRAVVFDMAECYPEMYRSIQQFGANRMLNWVIKNPTLTLGIEKLAVRHADHVFVMIEESRDRLLANGVAASKVTIVSNTPPLVDSAPRHHADTDPLRFLYVGFVTRIRGLDNFLRGLHHHINESSPAVMPEFDVVGVGDALGEYRALARQLGIERCVRFHGWCEQSFVDELYARSDVGVLTYRVCGHWNHTIPNKLFDYMRSGMPVLATDVVPIRRIVEQEQCGLIIRDGDAISCSTAIARLGDASLRSALGSRGRAAVMSRYNWQVDERRMLAVIESLDRD